MFSISSGRPADRHSCSQYVVKVRLIIREALPDATCNLGKCTRDRLFSLPRESALLFTRESLVSRVLEPYSLQTSEKMSRGLWKLHGDF